MLDRPHIGLELKPFVDAYLALSSSRQIGFGGPQPISMESLTSYYRQMSFTDWSDYVEILQAMDSEFLSQFAQRKPTPPAKKGRS